MYTDINRDSHPTLLRESQSCATWQLISAASNADSTCACV